MAKAQLEIVLIDSGDEVKNPRPDVHRERSAEHKAFTRLANEAAGLPVRDMPAPKQTGGDDSSGGGARRPKEKEPKAPPIASQVPPPPPKEPKPGDDDEPEDKNKTLLEFAGREIAKLMSTIVPGLGRAVSAFDKATRAVEKFRAITDSPAGKGAAGDQVAFPASKADFPPSPSGSSGAPPVPPTPAAKPSGPGVTPPLKPPPAAKPVPGGGGAAAGAAGAALVKVAVVAAAAAAATVGFVLALKDAAKRIEEFSPEVSAAAARTEVRRELAQIRRAREIGPGVASFEDARGKFEDLTTRLWTEILNVLVAIWEVIEPFVTFMIDVFEVIVEFIGFMVDGIKAIINLLRGTGASVISAASNIKAMNGHLKQMGKEIGDLVGLGEDDKDKLVDPFMAELNSIVDNATRTPGRLGRPAARTPPII